MVTIRIPHLSDNYYEIAAAFKAIQLVFDSIFNNLDETFDKSLGPRLSKEMSEEEWQLNSQIYYHYKEDVGPQYLTYALLLIITSTVEKNLKILKTDGFKITNKRKIVTECSSKGIKFPAAVTDIDEYLDDLFELRNYIAHCFGLEQADPKNEKIRNILASNPSISEDWEGNLIIEKTYLDGILNKLADIFTLIAKTAYSV